jgi:hypothetical protein
MNKLVQKYPVLGSSVDPAHLSLLIKGVLGLVATILVGFGYSQIELDGLIDQIVNFVLLASQLVTLGMAIWGGVRKFVK